MGNDGNLEQIERIQSSIDLSLSRVKNGLAAQSANLRRENALEPPPYSAPATSLVPQVNIWGENTDTPVNRLLKLHRDMSTIRTTAQVRRHALLVKSVLSRHNF
jgi:hypothetical protein